MAPSALFKLNSRPEGGLLQNGDVLRKNEDSTRSMWLLPAGFIRRLLVVPIVVGMFALVYVP